MAPASFMMNNNRAEILGKIKAAGVPVLLITDRCRRGGGPIQHPDVGRDAQGAQRESRLHRAAGHHARPGDHDEPEGDLRLLREASEEVVDLCTKRTYVQVTRHGHRTGADGRSAQAQTCTRDNLKTFIANYFKAVETHDLSALPTATSLRITENGVETKPGEGFVKTGGKATLLRSLIDTEQCGTVTQALVDETINGTTDPTIVAVRLKVVAGKVSEIETLLGRKGASKMAGFDFYDPKALLATRDQDWEVPLPPGQRPTRDYMNEHANRYLQQLRHRSQRPRC